MLGIKTVVFFLARKFHAEHAACTNPRTGRNGNDGEKF